jgi:uncharacterized membrane protein YhfC
MSRRKWAVGLIIILVLTLLTGCEAEEPEELEGAFVTGATLLEEEVGSLTIFNIPVEETGEPIGIDFRGTLISGSVRVQLLAPDGEVFWEEVTAEPGLFAVNTVVEPEEPGEYDLGLAWDGPVQASYNLRWQPGEIEITPTSPLILVGGLGMMLVAIGFVVYAALRRLGWGYMGLGAVAWMITVALKFLWAIPFNTPIYEALTGGLPESAANLIFYLYVGALTGVFEVAGVWLLLRYTSLGKVEWERALAFGIGFGAIEALLLGLLSLVNGLLVLFAPEIIPPGTVGAIGLSLAIAPVWERFFTILIHIFSNVLLFYGAVKLEARWFWLAFAYKTAVDAVAAFGQLWGLDTARRIWLIEAIIALFGIAGWLGIRWVRARYPEAPAMPTELEMQEPEI